MSRVNFTLVLPYKDSIKIVYKKQTHTNIVVTILNSVRNLIIVLH